MDVDSWRKLWEQEQTELIRSERVQQQLRAVLLQLQQKHEDLEKDHEKLLAEVYLDERCKGLDMSLEAATEACLELRAEQSNLELRSVQQTREQQRHASRKAELEKSIEDMNAVKMACEQDYQSAVDRHESASSRARSMVSAEALERVMCEAKEIRGQLEEQQVEAARLRESLADSWAARAAGPDIPEDTEAASSGSGELQALEGMEEELKWLSRMQQAAQAEVHHLQHLERTEVALQSQLRAVSEEKAALQSDRVDLGDAGSAMREAIASQSEGYIKRVGCLEEERKRQDSDRIKLISECADLQARLDDIAPELEPLSDLESRHAKLESEQRRLADESKRLRIINAALGAQLMGATGSPMGSDDEGSAAVSDAINRILELHKRFVERQEAHSTERQKLADRIRTLERENAQGIGHEMHQPSTNGSAAPKRTGAATAGRGNANPITSATSALRGGFGRIRDAALTVL